ncbi:MULTISPECIES: IS4 family transposase [unclassified Pseudoalteromonas]|uniref:IS4 family transposase n=1 Tax=unclassified Pseudoalteromonas TaxID=194690 RepID=UPI0013FDE3A3|nr:MULTISPECIES: IS4 family transposase [unclassified Pseudoalteromonas]MBH0005019.1 IS4 family transposase [Pseudoalteromonas sp. SWYJZ12]
MLSHWLLDTDIFATPDSLSTFQKHIPLEWISNVLEQTDKASIRKRKLPAELVVWLIIAMGLFRDRSISDVVEKLDLTLTDTLGDTVAPSAIPQARQRLSSDPLQALFHLCAAHWTQEEDADDTWYGLRLFSVDGTQFRAPDTPALAEHFHYIKHSKNRHTEYPIVRLCALSSLRSRLIHHVAFGPSYQGEVNYAKQLFGHVSDNSLTIFDRCYLSAELLINWRKQHPQSHWMVPIKSNTQYTVIESYSEHDFKVEMSVSAHARKQDPSLPECWQARLVLYPEPMGPGKIKGLLCSLDDKQAFGAQAILDVYFERWEIENSYGEIKHQMLEDSILLRSQTVDGVNQELWGILLAYNLIRVEISRIAKEAKVSPLRISFVMALRDIQDEILWCAIASPGSIPKKLRAMRERVKRYILPEKRKRPKSRTVRISKTRYTIKSKHA